MAMFALEFLNPLRSEALPIYSAGVVGLAAFIGAPIGYVLGWLQQGVVRRCLDYNLRLWREVSLIGGIFGSVLAFIVVEELVIEESLERSIDAGISPISWFIACISLAQWFILRRHTRAAWLWIPVNILSAGLWGFDPDIAVGGLLILGVMASGLLTGLTMLNLFQRWPRSPKPKSKQKRAMDDKQKK